MNRGWWRWRRDVCYSSELQARRDVETREPHRITTHFEIETLTSNDQIENINLLTKN